MPAKVQSILISLTFFAVGVCKNVKILNNHGSGKWV